MAFTLTSPSFAAGARIPTRHTGEGEDVSPELRWQDAPAGTAELCLLCEDPDAPRPQPWVHWLVAGIPATRTSLHEGDAKGLVQGITDFGEPGWGGPMPPRGHGTHHYRFRLFALDRPSGLGSRFSKGDLLGAIKGHVIAETELVGTYERP